jgi:hypothetical protein
MPMRTGPQNEMVPQIRTWLVTKIVDYLDVPQQRLFFERASADLEALVENGGERESWAPLGLFHEALEIADRVAGDGQLGSCWSIGRFSAQHEAGPVRSFALKVLRPATVMSLATSLWQVHYRNAGRAVAQVAGPTAMKFSLVDYPSPHRGHCLAVGGWVQGALELGPRRAVHVKKITCRCDRATSCDYSVSWEQV